MKDCFNLIHFLSNKLLFFDSSLIVRDFTVDLIDSLSSKHKDDMQELSDINKIARIIT